MPISLRSFFIRYAPRYGPHYGVAVQGVLRGVGLLYVLSIWSVASQLVALSGPRGLLPASSFYQFLLQNYGDAAPWLHPGWGWISQDPIWMLALCAVGVLAGLGLLYGFLPWISGLVAWTCWVSLIQFCQPWLSTPGDLLLSEVGFLVLFLVPIRSVFYPSVAELASRLTGIIFLNLLLVRVIFLSGLAKLYTESGFWAEGTALFYFFETQPFPMAGGWLLHQLPASLLTYLLWGWMFIELMLPWYTFLPRVFRNCFAGAVVVRSLVLLCTGQHGIYPWLCILLALSLVDDVSWRRLLPISWGPSASTQIYQPGWTSRIALLAFAPLFLFQSTQGRSTDVPRPWKWVKEGLGHVYVAQAPQEDLGVEKQRFEVSLQGSRNGEAWTEYLFWMKPTNPMVLPTAGLMHIPRLDVGFEAFTRSELLAEGKIPVWMLQLIQGLLQGEPQYQSLFPVNPFPDQPPSYLRLVLYEYSFADPVTRREEGVWWVRTPVGSLGPVFSLQQIR